jgi:hypothetical protein
MNKIKFCRKIKKVIRNIIVVDGNNPDNIGVGTGVIVDSNGTLLTASHVIEGYSNPKIIVMGPKDIPQIIYSSYFKDVSINVDMEDYIKPLKIDLAILKPQKQEKIKNIAYVKLADEISQEGEEVLMAGFPDEVKLPLNFNKFLNFDNPDIKEEKEEIDKFIFMFNRLLMIKSGMIGSVQKININNSKWIDEKGVEKRINVQGASYWIDNGCTYGASGGLVVNSKGNLIGIICEKGMTFQNNIEIELPSGSTMALSQKLITWNL